MNILGENIIWLKQIIFAIDTYKVVCGQRANPTVKTVTHTDLAAS